MNAVSLDFTGMTGILAKKISKKWLIGINEADPAMLAMFEDRLSPSPRTLMPWSGEFAGKYITSCYYIWRTTGDAELLEYVKDFIEKLMALQADDGYLGIFETRCLTMGAFPKDPTTAGTTWDCWAHYHWMYGLLTWYSELGDERYLECVKKGAELFIRTFYNGNPPLSACGSSEMNTAILHAFVMLYEITAEPKYLDFARELEKDLSSAGCGDYVNNSLSGNDYYQCPKPRWESMHTIMALAELYPATGERKYLDITEQIFFSILKTDVHNTGAFSTEEKAIGNPYTAGAIETCCVVAYNALALRLYELTHDIRYIDFLERAHYNAVLGYYNPSGKWATYNTPMDGAKRGNYQDIVFQSAAASPELNCCSVNAPRGVGMFSQWAVCADGDRMYINCYESCKAKYADAEVTISGAYPAEGKVHLSVKNAKNLDLLLRVPSWSAETTISVAGKTYNPKSAAYLELGRLDDCEIDISFCFGVRTEEGALDCEGKTSIFKGPVLFAFDAHDNKTADVNCLAPIERKKLANAKETVNEKGEIKLLLDDGTVLTDFRSAGVYGNEYRSWLRLS